MQLLANTLTAFNMIAGFAAIVLLSQGEFAFAAYFILTATLFDLFDGRVARKLEKPHPIGKAFDNLADLISFGATPGFLFYQLLFGKYASIEPDTILHIFPIHLSSTEIVYPLGVLLASCFLIGSAYRLARFHATDQSKVFLGLPAPVATAFFFVLALTPMLPFTLFFCWVDQILPDVVNLFRFPWWSLLFFYVGIILLMISPFVYTKAGGFFRFGRSVSLKWNLGNGILILAVLFLFKFAIIVGLVIYFIQPILLELKLLKPKGTT